MALWNCESEAPFAFAVKCNFHIKTILSFIALRAYKWLDLFVTSRKIFHFTISGTSCNIATRSSVGNYTYEFTIFAYTNRNGSRNGQQKCSWCHLLIIALSQIQKLTNMHHRIGPLNHSSTVSDWKLALLCICLFASLNFRWFVVGQLMHIRRPIWDGKAMWAAIYNSISMLLEIFFLMKSKVLKWQVWEVWFKQLNWN